MEFNIDILGLLILWFIVLAWWLAALPYICSATVVGQQSGGGVFVIWVRGVWCFLL